MPKDHQPSKPSYSEAHERWVQKHSLTAWDRLFFGILLPAPGVSGLNWALGTLGRLVVLALVTAAAYSFMLKRHLSSSDFSKMIATECEEILQADSVQCSPIYWKGNEAFIALLEATGSSDSFFKTLRAEGVRFEVPWSTRFKAAWSLEDISISDLDIELRLGGVGPIPPESSESSAPPTPKQARAQTQKIVHPLRAGFGVNPELAKLTFEEILVDEAQFHWGRSNHTHGSLAKAGLRATRSNDDDSWTLQFDSGLLSQNWLRDINLSSLEVVYQAPNIFLKNGNGSLGDSGKAAIEGQIVTGEIPGFDVRIDLSNVDFTSILPEDFATILTGHFDANLKIEGSINTKSGVAIAGDLTFRDGTLRDLKALNTLTGLYADSRFRRLRISLGYAKLITRENFAQITDFTLKFGDFGELGGKFVVETSASAFDGVVAFGIRPETLSKHPRISEIIFKQDEEGYRWAVIPLTETIKNLTRSFADQLAAAAHQDDQAKLRSSP